MADLVIGGAWQALDGNGDPIPGALAYFYDTGTTTPRTTYQDVSGSTPHDDPVEADANGFFPEIFVAGGTAVKCVLKTAAGVTVTTQDPCVRINTAAAAAAISFTPTAEIAQTNVQDAIEQVQTNYEADLAVEVAALDADISALDAAKQDLNANLTAISGLTVTRGGLITKDGSAIKNLAVGTSGQFLTTDGTDVSWGAVSTGGLTLLGTITTTGGTSAPLGSLDLTGYKFLIASFDGVSSSSNGFGLTFPETGVTVAASVNQSDSVRGTVIIDLSTGAGSANLGPATSAAPSSAVATPYALNTTLSTASTSVAVGVSVGTFDAMSITVYGLK